MQTHDLGNNWYAIHSDPNGKTESMVLNNSKTGESIALGTESLKKLREIFKQNS